MVSAQQQQNLLSEGWTPAQVAAIIVTQGGTPIPAVAAASSSQSLTSTSTQNNSSANSSYAQDTNLINTLRQKIATGQIDPNVALEQAVQNIPPTQRNDTTIGQLRSQIFAPMAVNQNGRPGQLNSDGSVTFTGTQVNQSNTSITGNSSTSQNTTGNNTYQYIKSDGSVGTVQAPDAQTAMKTASGIAPNSGVQKIADAPTNTGGGTKTSTVAGMTPDQMWQYASKTGITQDQYNTLSPDQKATIALVGETSSQLYSYGNTGVTVQQALDAAAKNPDIIAKYSDTLGIDTATFQQNLSQLQQATTTQNQQYQTQFANDRKALADQQAAAGAAYSGFRGKAQQDLLQSESGIVQSSRAQIQKNLQDATTAFEAKYGTSATTPASLTYIDPLANTNVNLTGQKITPTTNNQTLSGTLIGNITGTQPIEKRQDIVNQASTDYSLGAIV